LKSLSLSGLCVPIVALRVKTSTSFFAREDRQEVAEFAKTLLSFAVKKISFVFSVVKKLRITPSSTSFVFFAVKKSPLCPLWLKNYVSHPITPPSCSSRLKKISFVFSVVKKLSITSGNNSFVSFVFFVVKKLRITPHNTSFVFFAVKKSPLCSLWLKNYEVS
jgi:hypothetical protein